MAKEILHQSSCVLQPRVQQFLNEHVKAVKTKINRCRENIETENKKFLEIYLPPESEIGKVFSALYVNVLGFTDAIGQLNTGLIGALKEWGIYEEQKN